MTMIDEEAVEVAAKALYDHGNSYFGAKMWRALEDEDKEAYRRAVRRAISAYEAAKPAAEPVAALDEAGVHAAIPIGSNMADEYMVRAIISAYVAGSRAGGSA